MLGCCLADIQLTLDDMKRRVLDIILITSTLFFNSLACLPQAPRVMSHPVSFLGKAVRGNAEGSEEIGGGTKALNQDSFAFLDIPPEIYFLVFANCVDWLGMYLSLCSTSLATLSTINLSMHFCHTHTPNKAHRTGADSTLLVVTCVPSLLLSYIIYGYP